MSTWVCMVTHNVAHIQPTLTMGTNTAGWPLGNVRTLDPNIRARFTGATIQIDFDRGTGNLRNVNALYIAGATENAASPSFGLYADTVSGFTSPTTLIDGSSWTLDEPEPRMFYFASNAERYLRVEITTNTGTMEIGTISIGRAYTLPGELRGATVTGGKISGAFTRSFRVVPVATAQALLDRYNADFTYKGASQDLPQYGTTRDALGCAGGRRPIVLGEWNAALTNDSEASFAYYGPASVTVDEWAAAYAQVNITMQPIPIGPILSV